MRFTQPFTKITFTLGFILVVLVTASSANAFSLGSIFGGGGGGIQGAGVTLVNDISSQSAIRNTVLEGLIQIESEEAFRDTELTKMVWEMNNLIMSQMVDDNLEYLATGRDGEPAFVTDVPQHLLDTMDEEANTFLNDEGLQEMCSTHEVDVRTALTRQYSLSRASDSTSNGTAGQRNQCKLQDYADNMESFLNGKFTDGGWDAWFTLTQDQTGAGGDANKAYIENKERMRVAVNTGRDIELVERASKGFFYDIEVCDGDDCQISTPGNLIEAQVNATLELPKQRLAVADGYDHTVEALFSQVSDQTFLGINGIFGMIADSIFSDNRYGSDGNSSYLNAMNEAGVQKLAEVSNLDPFADALENEQVYVDLLGEIEEFVDDYSKQIEEAEEEYGSCFSVRMTPELTDARDAASSEAARSNTIISILEALSIAYRQAQAIDIQQALISQFAELKSENELLTASGITEAKLSLEYILPDLGDELQDEIDDEIANCDSSGLTS